VRCQFSIHTYEATEEDAARQAADTLTKRLRNVVSPAPTSIFFDLVLEQLEEEGACPPARTGSPAWEGEALETIGPTSRREDRLVLGFMQRLETENPSLSI